MKALFFSAVSVAAVVITAAGLVVLALGLRNLFRASRTRRWPGVPGTIEAARVVETPSREAGPDGQVQTLYRAQVQYRYPGAGGQALSGSRVSLDEVSGSAPGPAQALVARYPPGASVMVFHDPADPAQAVLEPGISGASALLPGVGVGLLALAAGMWGIVRLWSGA